MSEKVLDKATQYIDALASKLGVAAEHVYGVLYRQQIAEGIGFLISELLFIIVGALACWLYIRYTKEKRQKAKEKYVTSDSDDFVIFGYYAIMIVYVIVSVICLINIPFGVMKIINPEYYAIKEIFDAFK